MEINPRATKNEHERGTRWLKMHRRFDAPARSIDRWIISTYTHKEGSQSVPARNEFQERKEKKNEWERGDIRSITHHLGPSANGNRLSHPTFGRSLLPYHNVVGRERVKEKQWSMFFFFFLGSCCCWPWKERERPKKPLRVPGGCRVDRGMCWAGGTGMKDAMCINQTGQTSRMAGVPPTRNLESWHTGNRAESRKPNGQKADKQNIKVKGPRGISNSTP